MQRIAGLIEATTTQFVASHRLSHRELARRLGLGPGTVAAWERDEISPA
ncbi:MAG: helix-turn-helix transcriptional regulator [Acidobacteria bacterium]|nr:helix-turn-helix transcriptional regulator [Acidobacteriota bacterium]